LRVVSVRNKIRSDREVDNLINIAREYAKEKDAVVKYDMAIWYDEDSSGVIDAEGAVAIEAKKGLIGNGAVAVRDLPSLDKVAYMEFQGSYRALPEVSNTLRNWLLANGYSVVGPLRTLYLRGGDEEDNPSYLTEIQYPVKKTR
jgi:effector-binding domain-containing protein